MIHERRAAPVRMMRAFLDHTKCPDACVEHITSASAAGAPGFFKLGDLRLYGSTSGASTAYPYDDALAGVDELITCRNGSVCLPFDPTETIDNLRHEKYVGAVNSEIPYIADSHSISRRIYYALRPVLGLQVRTILQRIALQNWSRIPFPAWPVDTTVEDLIGWLWTQVLKSSGAREIPFIWYWPKGFQSCAIMTHDVETRLGRELCPRILELERPYHIRSAFELVPEERYSVPEQLLAAIRRADGEVCVQGLNHDGNLFSSEEEFRKQAEAINRYGAKWGAKGFRSPVMYRNQAWYDAFDFSYDMSVPNVGHLDPQRGGCCTVFPFFIGDVLELPLTTVQDYSVYHILRSDPLSIWGAQMETVHKKHGLVSFIIHPDYTEDRQKQALFCELLGLMRKYSDEREMWLALPGEVDDWWRERSAMTLVREGGTWSIRGKGSNRACLAYARLERGKLTYVLPNRDVECADQRQS